MQTLRARVLMHAFLLPYNNILERKKSKIKSINKQLLTHKTLKHILSHLRHVV
jgi:hypothetical protein